MRLTCPNCGAQYEVPDEVIPDTGRDVQCSNCGDTWFQYHPDHPPAEEPAEADDTQPSWDSPTDDTEPDFAPEEPEEEVAEAEEDVPDERQETDPAEDEPQAEDDDTDDEPVEEGDTIPEVDATEEGDQPDDAEPSEEEILQQDATPEEAEDREPPRRGLDPSVTDVLREEAAREEEARAAEGSGGLETQPDLGLDETSDGSDERAEQVKSRMARLRGLPEDAAEAPEEEPDPSLISRRNLLPDIDEINSSLDSETTRAEGGEAAVGGAAEAVRRGGFNRGFMRGVLLVVVLVLLYLLAPMISENIPALAGAMEGYVSLVNSGRAWLNDMVGGMTGGG